MFFSFTVSSSRCGNATNGNAAPLVVLAGAGAGIRVMVIVLSVIIVMPQRPNDVGVGGG